MNRILLIRTSAIGDVVFASPLAHALRRSFPRAHIAWLVEAGIEGLIEADSALDEVVVWPRRHWAKLWRERRWLELARAVRAFRGMLHARRYDTALDVQGLLKSGALAMLSGAPQRIGLGSREASRALMTRVVPRGGAVARISSEYLHFAQALGLQTGDFVPRLAVSDATGGQVQDLLKAHGLVPGRFAVFAPFTTRPQKHWFEDAWQGLATHVRTAFDLTPVLLGGPGDREAAGRVAAGSSIADLTGRTSLAQAAGVIQQAALVIGVDTGLTHIGIALNRPTVALFGSTRPYLDACRSNARVIWLGLHCSPCKRAPTCDGAFTCLRNITPARVLEEAKMALAPA